MQQKERVPGTPHAPDHRAVAAGGPGLAPGTVKDADGGSRIGTTFTYYNRTTKDAIIGRTIPPSLWPGNAGDFAGGLQYVNIGEIKGWGTETTVSAQVIPAFLCVFSLGRLMITSASSASFATRY